MKGKNLLPRLLLIAASLFLAFPILAQNIMPAAYSSNVPQNYIRTWEATAPISNPDTLKARGLKDVKQTTQYVDGLGRPLQTVIKQGSLVTGGSAIDLAN